MRICFLPARLWRASLYFPMPAHLTQLSSTKHSHSHTAPYLNPLSHSHITSHHITSPRSLTLLRVAQPSESIHWRVSWVGVACRRLSSERSRRRSYRGVAQPSQRAPRPRVQRRQSASAGAGARPHVVSHQLQAQWPQCTTSVGPLVQQVFGWVAATLADSTGR
jgi:hypothetical protein